MSLAGHGPKHGSRHRCLIIASTEQQGPVQCKGDKGVNTVARPLENGLAKAGVAFRPQVCLCLIMPAGGKANSKLMLLAFLCVWKQIPWRNIQTIVLPQDFLHILLQWFDR